MVKKSDDDDDGREGGREGGRAPIRLHSTGIIAVAQRHHDAVDSSTVYGS